MSWSPPRLLRTRAAGIRGNREPEPGDFIVAGAAWYRISAIEAGYWLLQEHGRPPGYFEGEGPWALLDRRGQPRIVFAYRWRPTVVAP